jgi:enoyl-CoA hydratase
VTDLVTYSHADGVTTIVMDDGKVNVFSIAMLESLHAAFDEAEQQETVVVLTGRPGSFSAGFDLNVLRSGPAAAVTLLRLGATLAERILAFPSPVVAACTGHAFPAGAFLLMAADHRLGVDGPYKLGLNEVRIGLTLPWFAIVLARHRLTPSSFDRATVTGTMFNPAGAREAGLLDTVVALDDLAGATVEIARELAEVDRAAHTATKLRVRQPVLAELRAAIDDELRTGHPAPADA